MRKSSNLNSFRKNTEEFSEFKSPPKEQKMEPISELRKSIRPQRPLKRKVKLHLKFQNGINSIIDECEEERTEIRNLSQKVNLFEYFCHKMAKKGEKSCLRKQEDNCNDRFNVYQCF